MLNLRHSVDAQRWYRVELPPQECVRNGKADRLQKAFEVMFITNERPTGAASFEWFDERLETNVFYFSPVAAALMRPLIEEVGGVECAPPLASHWLVFLNGDEQVLEGLQCVTGDRT
jgi:hypothetical protein